MNTNHQGPAIEVRDLTRDFGKFRAVDRVSFTVAQGEIFGFLGPNGAGKSTTIRMLNGLLLPTAGEGWVDGLHIVRDQDRIKSRIGYMSQRFSLYEDLTAEENLSFFGGVYGLPLDRLKARLEEVLALVGLNERRRDLTRDLALGLRQRLALASAVLHEPAILFLDEPTSGVDPISRRNFWDLIYAMADQGVTILVTTHYMDEAEFCDRLVLIYQGRVIAAGSPRELKGSLPETILAVYPDRLGEALEVARHLPEIGEAAVFGDGLHVAALDPEVAAAALRQALTRAGIRIERLSRIPRASRMPSSRLSNGRKGADVDIKRTWAIFRKELIHIRRDYQSLVQVVLLPVMLLILYGYALTFDIKDVPTAVYDQEGSRVSQDFLRNFQGTKYFDLRYRVTSFNDIRRLMDAREIRLALVIPYDFSRSLKSGQTAKIQAILDGTDANTANIIQGYVQGVVQAFNQDILIERLNRRGVSQAKPPVTAGIRFWFNEDLESKNFIIPGLIVIIMTMVGALLTALTIVREVERGSMESLLATPLKKTELILGKLGPYFLLGLLDLGIALAMGEFLFQVPLKGSIALFIVLSAVFLLVMLGMGMLISITSENQLQAYQMATLTTFLPAFLLSGFVFAIPLMPRFLQVASYLVPARYLVTICKGIYLKGVGLEVLWPSALMLVFFAVFFLALAIRRFRHKIG